MINKKTIRKSIAVLPHLHHITSYSLLILQLLLQYLGSQPLQKIMSTEEPKKREFRAFEI